MRPNLTVLPPLQFALSLISDIAPNASEALPEFSRLYAGKTNPPSGYLNEVAVWQEPLSEADRSLDDEPRISFQSDRISFTDFGRKTVLQIKASDAERALPDLAKAGLTNSELRLAIVLSSGLTLQEAAAQDGTSYQTKRTQLKSVFSKTGHAKQHALAASVGSELATFFEKFHRAKEETAFQWRSYAKFLPSGVRAGILYDPAGDAVPYLDYGPADGDVTFVLHPFIFPRLETEDVTFAAEQGRRFIYPIRPGVLGRPSPETYDWGEHIEACVNELALCFETFSSDKSQIVALVSSAPIAAHFAKAHPEKVSSISFAATCYPPGFAGDGQSGFWSSIMQLLAMDNYLGHSTVQFVGALAVEPDLFKQGILTTYEKNDTDQDLIHRELREDRVERLMFATLESYRSIAHDFKGLFEFDWNSLSSLKTTTRFVHGGADRIHDLEVLNRFAASVAEEGLSLVPDVSQWTEGASLRSLLRVANEVPADL